MVKHAVGECAGRVDNRGSGTIPYDALNGVISGNCNRIVHRFRGTTGALSYNPVPPVYGAQIHPGFHGSGSTNRKRRRVGDGNISATAVEADSLPIFFGVRPTGTAHEGPGILMARSIRYQSSCALTEGVGSYRLGRLGHDRFQSC